MSSLQQQSQMTTFSYHNVYSLNQNQSVPFYKQQSNNQQTQSQQQQSSMQAQDENIKYTCRFDVQIENDKEF